MKRTNHLWISVILILLVSFGGQSLALANQEQTSPSREAGLGLGSGLLTLVYLPCKIVYAAVGGIVGGLTYGVTGGNLEAAQSVWKPSFYGTYVITPEHLKGNEPVRFYGSEPYEEEGEIVLSEN